MPKLIGSGKKLESISRTPMPDMSNLDMEDEYSHRIAIDADDDAEYEVMITEVEKPTNEKLEEKRSNPNFKTKTLREDLGEVTDEEFVTQELLESNTNKVPETKGQFVILKICNKNLSSMSIALVTDEKLAEMGGLSTTKSR